MPDQLLLTSQATDLVAFFQWVGGVDTNGWPPVPKSALGAAGTSNPGAVLFEQKGCIGCHMINGNGATGPGPDLSKIGSLVYDSLPNDAPGLTKWLQDPPAMKPGTAMPNFGLTQDEVSTLVTYLTSLK